MLDFILCNGYLPKSDISGYVTFSESVKFDQHEYGQQFGLVPQTGAEEAISSVLGKPCAIKRKESFILRKPHNCLIHFEKFDSLKEWCFITALVPTTFNILKHKTGALTALHCHELNYRYVPDWDYRLNVILSPGEGVFFRPWLFHSLENGLIIYNKVIEL